MSIRYELKGGSFTLTPDKHIMKHIKSHPPLVFDKVTFRSKQEQKLLVLRKVSEIGAKARRCAGVCNGASHTPRHNLHHHQNPVRRPVRPQTIPNLTPTQMN